MTIFWSINFKSQNVAYRTETKMFQLGSQRACLRMGCVGLVLAAKVDANDEREEVRIKCEAHFCGTQMFTWIMKRHHLHNRLARIQLIEWRRHEGCTAGDNIKCFRKLKSFSCSRLKLCCMFFFSTKKLSGVSIPLSAVFMTNSSCCEYNGKLTIASLSGTRRRWIFYLTSQSETAV